MRRLASRLNVGAVFVLTLLALGAALFAYATSTVSPEEALTARTDRDVSTLTTDSCTIVPEKELFITDLSVVNDCWRTSSTTYGCTAPTGTPADRGAWTVGHLMEGIFGTTDPAILSDRTLSWLRQWENQQTVNGEIVPARSAITGKVIDPWLAASAIPNQLDMAKAPFRLLAIVARLDLRQNSSYSEGISAGEARFIFNVLNQNGAKTQFNVIFEYELEADDCADVLAWANDWHALGSIPFGDSYNAALQALTSRFTDINASPGKVNGSAIKQVRSNEIFLAPEWELREFRLREGGTTVPTPLVERPVKQTPRLSLNNSQTLADYINANEALIKKDAHVVPIDFQQQPFLGGRASNPFPRVEWDGPGAACSSVAPKARHHLALNTCQGCHGPEVGLGEFEFVQVNPRKTNEAATLSAFLTGTSTTDRCGLAHTFGDIKRRRKDLCRLLSSTCTELEAEPVVTFVH
jgi:hypothetical protein